MKKTDLVDKFSSFFSFFKDQENLDYPIFKINFEIKDIETIYDLEKGTIIIHKSSKLYKIYDFGLFQILDKWQQAVYYKEVFPVSEVDRATMYGLTFNNLKTSFKIVKNFDQGILKLK